MAAGTISISAFKVPSFFFFFFLTFLSSEFQCSSAQKWVRAGYWYVGSDTPISDIDSSLFTHLLCGFATVNNSTYEVSFSSNAVQKFTVFTSVVKQKNPSVLTLLSIWNGQYETGQAILGKNVNNSVLSEMLTQPSYRKSFIDSSIRSARLYGFHGIDLFWLWPNSTDLSRIGTLLDEWRAAIASDARNSSVAELVLTMGVRYTPNREIVSYPIDSMKRNLDWAHVVAYDYHMPSVENFTGNHAALYNPSSNVTTDFGIKQWLGGGYPPSKLVLGLPYHGYAWKLVDPNQNSLGAPAAGPAITIDGGIGYAFIKSFIRNYGYGAAPTYNSTYVVNYFIAGSTWINFDGEETIRAKIAYAQEKGLLGYNVFQIMNDDNWSLSLAALGKDGRGNKRLLLLKILLPMALMVTLLACITCYYRRRVTKRKETMALGLGSGSFTTPGPSTPSTQKHDSHPTTLQVFSLATIKEATDNFSSENKLGGGGFGPVYKGRLPSGHEIAVKRLSASSAQGFEEFKNEVSLTAGLQHVNLVRVLGFCTENEEKMLIYEFMPNRSLDLYLYDPIKRQFLDWNKRVRIIEGVTQGLLYLQEYSNFTIIHRDVKASNILLDEEMNPKISDFGMAKLFRKDVFEANTGRIVGTYGYVPPEYVKQGIYSMKYDVYSFGVVLLQIISSKRNTCFYGERENLNILEYAYDLWSKGQGMEFIDPSLDDSSSSCKLMRCMQVALLCVQESPVDRPTMLEVFSMLKNETMDISVPKRPAFATGGESSNAGTGSSSIQEVYSVNSAQLSELQPR